jgi:hypothetical protein
LGPLVFGRAVARGSWYGKIAYDGIPNGGFMMGSLNGSSEDCGNGNGTIPYFSVDTMSLMNLFYGSDGTLHVPLLGRNSGYKFYPIQHTQFGNRIGSAGNVNVDCVYASVTTSDDSIVRFYHGVGSSNATSAATSASMSMHFVFAGFIISGPNFPGNANP